jgi:hypothetical protein
MFHSQGLLTMYTSRDRRARQPAAHELQQSHLGTSILHSNAVRLQFQVCLTSDVPSTICVVHKRLLWTLKMRVENLLGQSQLS